MQFVGRRRDVVRRDHDEAGHQGMDAEIGEADEAADQQLMETWSGIPGCRTACVPVGPAISNQSPPPP